MTALVVICLVVPALWLGYCLGRRAGATKSAAKRRPRRAALSKWVMRWFALMIVTQVQRSMRRKLSMPHRTRLTQSKLRRPSFVVPLSRLS